MHSIKINGFKSIEAATMFMSWYSNQGEQDLDTFLECQDVELENNFICRGCNKDTLEMEIG